MQINTYDYPKSSFLGLGKDTALIMERILQNQMLLKLLYYNRKDVLMPGSVPNVTGEQIKEMFDTKQISTVPRVQISEDGRKITYLRLTYDSFAPNGSNSYYRDHIMELKIICHFDHWNLTDYELRPYRIAGELDSMLDGKKLTGIGTVQLINADQDIYDNEYGGITLQYLVTRGHEDDINTVQKL